MVMQKAEFSEAVRIRRQKPHSKPDLLDQVYQNIDFTKTQTYGCIHVRHDPKILRRQSRRPYYRWPIEPGYTR